MLFYYLMVIIGPPHLYLVVRGKKNVPNSTCFIVELCKFVSEDLLILVFQNRDNCLNEGKKTSPRRVDQPKFTFQLPLR